MMLTVRSVLGWSLLALLTLAPPALAQGALMLRDSDGRQIATISLEGDVHDASGRLAGWIRGGEARDSGGTLLGRLEPLEMRRATGALAARYTLDGDVRHPSGRLMFRVGPSGVVRLSGGQLYSTVRGYTPDQLPNVIAYLLLFRAL